MTPPKLDMAIVQGRLRLLVESLESLATLQEVDADSLAQDPIKRAAAERLIQLVVDLAFDINGHIVVARLGRAPVTGRESFLDLATAGVLDTDLAASLAPSAGLRNILVHHYIDVRHDLVAASIGDLLRLFPEYVSSVANSVLPTDH